MEEREVNFVAIGVNMLIDLGEIISTISGIIRPDQAKKKGEVLESDIPYRIVEISDIGKEVLYPGMNYTDEDKFIYLAPHADPVVMFEDHNKRYALVSVHDVAGYAPDGFNYESYLEHKEEKREQEKELVKSIRLKKVDLSK